jgi:hypothetical protein
MYPCEERDVWRAAYEAALDGYIDAVKKLVSSSRSDETNTGFAEVERCRDALRRHCVEHGCDPEWNPGISHYSRSV